MFTSVERSQLEKCWEELVEVLKEVTLKSVERMDDDEAFGDEDSCLVPEVYGNEDICGK